MPPQLAALICIAFILYVFWTDRKRKDGASHALWVPFLWVFFAASRYPSDWLQLGGPVALTAGSYTEGNPVNAAAFFLLIAAGAFVLSRRKIDWGQLLAKNKLIWLYLLYCLVSISWADYSLVSFKRWIKELGNLIM